MIVIENSQAARIVQQLKKSGRFFNVTFIKRSTGELRTMTCRGGVSKHVKGKGLAFNPDKKGLISVWETSKDKKGPEAYRFISVEGIQEIISKGVLWRVEKL